MYLPSVVFMSVVIAFTCVNICCLFSLQLYSKLYLGEMVSVVHHLAVGTVPGTVIAQQLATEWVNGWMNPKQWPQCMSLCIGKGTYTYKKWKGESHINTFLLSTWWVSSDLETQSNQYSSPVISQQRHSCLFVCLLVCLRQFFIVWDYFVCYRDFNTVYSTQNFNTFDQKSQ